MAATDVATPPSRGGMPRLRRNPGEGANDSTNSLVSSSNSDDPNGDSGVGLRPVSSGGIGKLADRLRRKSVDDRRGSEDSGKRLSALIPGRRNKLKRAKSSELKPNVDSPSPGLTGSNNGSDSSLAQAGSGRSSLFTDDNSDIEGKPTRPTLSPHQSHAGYLTLSAPELNPQSQPVATASSSDPGLATTATGSTTSIPRIIEPSTLQSSVFPDFIDTAGETSQLGDTARAETGTSSETGSAQNVGEGVEQHKAEASTPAVQRLVETSGERPITPTNRGRPRVNTDSLPATPPNLNETPTTFVTPPTPTDPHAEFPRRPPRQTASTRQRSDTSSSYDSIKHRRNQSGNNPSKLSQTIPAPLTPTVEETKTPGGTLIQPQVASGFFTSFLSAAQKTATQLSSTINAGPAPKKKGITELSERDAGGEEVIPGSESNPNITDLGGKQAAVDTLGKGDLNFAHLGISDGLDQMNGNGTTAVQNGVNQVDTTTSKAEEEAAARAVSEAYDKPVATAMSEAMGGRRPLSIASNDRLTLTGDQTPPRTGTDLDSIKRSGSVRSKLSGRRRRHRDSSATAGTANSIAAGLTASATGLQNVTGSGAGHRLTGFAVASKKRNKDFHTLFRSVPEDDYLIEDYSAALQRDILLHGRLYVSEGHICFSSNILGWVTNLVISFDEVVSVEKKSTAVIFPNAIVISTLHARNTFASFVARDSTYELLIGIWKITHPNLKSSLNGVTLDDSGTGDKTEVADPEGSEGGSETGSEDEVYDEDADDDDGGSLDDAGLAPSVAGSEVVEGTLSRKPSGMQLTTGNATTNGMGPKTNGVAPKGLESADAIVTGAAVTSDFPGPPTHDATQCTDSSDHYTNLLVDTIIPAPLGKVYSMTFGPASGAFMSKWLVEDQKSRELNMVDDKTGLDNDHKTMSFDYIKPLSGSIGPKQTKCLTTYNLVAFDLDKAVSVDATTQNPDVPSGSVFSTKTRYCLMWATGNSTRMVSTSVVEWTGKSWLKGPIEKGTLDGQIEYAKALTNALKAAVTTKPPVKGAAKKGKKRGRKDVFDAEAANAQREASVTSNRQASSWGVLEPVHTILKPAISILSPFLTSQVVIAVLTALLLYTWLNPPGLRGSMSISLPGRTSPERLVAYEEIWRREESNLWDWLETRVGLENIYVPSGDGAQMNRQKVLASRNMAKKVGDERMSERQINDAIRITEERLEALKGAVGRQREEKEKKKV